MLKKKKMEAYTHDAKAMMSHVDLKPKESFKNPPMIGPTIHPVA